ncbi:MAG: type II toxin-antitoxin system RelE/ParE family toxin [Candidatus Caccosoma sp.]|nr:type II toxin-antitoxin system RelE/ParE family toxin [Candidatus Caccosoma sp.]
MEKNNKYKVVILKQAENDIVEILNHISLKLNNPTAAMRLWNNIKDAISRVKLFPYAMPLIKNEYITLNKEYRRVNVNNYVIIYKIKKDEIHIIAILYAPSNIMESILNRL